MQVFARIFVHFLIGISINGISVPKDTKVTLDDGMGMELPDGGIIDKNGNITYPKGEKAELDGAVVKG